MLVGFWGLAPLSNHPADTFDPFDTGKLSNLRELCAGRRLFLAYSRVDHLVPMSSHFGYREWRPKAGESFLLVGELADAACYAGVASCCAEVMKDNPVQR